MILGEAGALPPPANSKQGLADLWVDFLLQEQAEVQSLNPSSVMSVVREASMVCRPSTPVAAIPLFPGSDVSGNFESFAAAVFIKVKLAPKSTMPRNGVAPSPAATRTPRMSPGISDTGTATSPSCFADFTPSPGFQRRILREGKSTSRSNCETNSIPNIPWMSYRGSSICACGNSSTTALIRGSCTPHPPTSAPFKAHTCNVELPPAAKPFAVIPPPRGSFMSSHVRSCGVIIVVVNPESKIK